MELLVAAVRWLVNLCKGVLWEATFWCLDRLGIDLGSAEFGSGGFGGGGGDGA